MKTIDEKSAMHDLIDFVVFSKTIKQNKTKKKEEEEKKGKSMRFLCFYKHICDT